MLFKLKHPELSFPILCVVSSDGCLFLKAIDVAKIRRVKNPGQFASGVSNLTAKDLVYRDFRLPVSLAKTRLLSLDSAKRYLEGVVEMDAFDEMFDTARVRGEPRPTIRAREADTLFVVKRSETTFAECFEKFKFETMAFLDRDCENERVIPVKRLGSCPPRFVTLVEGYKSYRYEIV